MTREFGTGFSEKSLWHMVRLVESFPDDKILSTLWRELSWSHLRRLAYLDDPLQREFYTELCRIERWSVRALDQKIGGMLFERTALSKKPEKVIRAELKRLRTDGELTPDLVFRDPYLLGFLGLTDRYVEKDVEDAIIRDLEHFLLELGEGFSFVARQKRITLDGKDHYIDLVFFHRGMRRLVAIELKLGEFQAADKGQMELYLRWLARHEMKPGEEAPIGLILCAGKQRETIELLELETSRIRVASYWLELLPRRTLARKLHSMIASARERIAARAAA